MTYREVMTKVVEHVENELDVEVEIATRGVALSVYPKNAWYDGTTFVTFSKTDAPFEIHLTDISPDALASPEQCEEGTCYTIEEEDMDMTVQVFFFGE